MCDSYVCLFEGTLCKQCLTFCIFNNKLRTTITRTESRKSDFARVFYNNFNFTLSDKTLFVEGTLCKGDAGKRVSLQCRSNKISSLSITYLILYFYFFFTYFPRCRPREGTRWANSPLWGKRRPNYCQSFSINYRPEALDVAQSYLLFNLGHSLLEKLVSVLVFAKETRILFDENVYLARCMCTQDEVSPDGSVREMC